MHSLSCDCSKCCAKRGFSQPPKSSVAIPDPETPFHIDIFIDVGPKAGKYMCILPGPRKLIVDKPCSKKRAKMLSDSYSRPF